MIALLLLACRSDGPQVQRAEEVGVMEQSAAIQGRDGGQSALLWGRSVWTYGDTVLNVADEDGRNWHHNSVSWSDDLDSSDGLGGYTEPLDSAGAPAYLMPPTAEEASFNDAHWDDGDCEEPCGARWAVWPGSPVWDAERSRALVFYGLIYAEPGDFNFEGVGSSVAIWDGPEGEPQRTPELLWGPDDGEWGNAAAIVADHVYTFSCPQDGLGRPCALGRAPLDAVQERDAWRYWTGDGWGTDPHDTEDLFDGAPIMSLSFNSWLNSWLVVYSPPLGDGVYARTAPELTGPWSDETQLYKVDGDSPYDATHHAELSEDGGRIETITWSRSTGEGWFGTEFVVLRVVLD